MVNVFNTLCDYPHVGFGCQVFNAAEVCYQPYHFTKASIAYTVLCKLESHRLTIETIIPGYNYAAKA